MSGLAIRRPYPVLSHEDAARIRSAAIEGLERIGVKVGTARGRKLLRKAGASVDERTETAKIPRSLTEEILGRPPVRVTLHARDPQRTAELDFAHVHLCNNGTGPLTLDFETGERRPSTAKDLADSARVSNALEHHHVFWPMCNSNDAPPEVRLYVDLKVSFMNTPKHILYASGANAEEARRLVAMGAAVAGGHEELRKRPIMSSVQTSIAPLQHDGPMMDGAFAFGAAGVPVSIFTMPTPGATGPVTLAGSVTVAAMEFLSGLVMCRLANPAAPVIWGCGVTPLDMKTTTRAGGAPEHGLTGVAITQLAHDFGVPSLTGGFDTTASVPGTQSAIEGFPQGLSVVLGGADLIVGLGLLEDAKTLSLVKLVIDDEEVAMIKRLADGIVVDDETIALDLIEKVGIGGMFLAEKHTMRHLRAEQFLPTLIDRRSVDLWDRDGRMSLEDRARAKVREALARPVPFPLEPSLIRRLDGMIDEASRAEITEPIR
ncbi:MAG TPA: trimethylamine methyltransferase family protein [Thermoplasmata archaeon]|nr:trimethylamine methyltransferase family protein [Thermoplasmata archaeon]